MLLALICVGCTTSATPTSWQSPLHQNHHLAGKIWLSAHNRFITRSELVPLLQQHALLLLGEKHDNPDHHRLRLELLRELLPVANRSLLVLEMMQRTQQGDIDSLDAAPLPGNDPELASRLAWDEEGWPWQFYGPAVRLALQRGATLRAGNISSSDIMEIYRNDNASDANQVLDHEQLQQLERDIDSSHCGMLPSSQFPAMVRVQQARDQQMAEALKTNLDDFDQRILLAGNYHIRHDLGVPNYLAQDLGEQALSLAFLEVDPAQDDPETYLQQFSVQRAYDVIWFTPALRQDDYCADMRASQAP